MSQRNSPFTEPSRIGVDYTSAVHQGGGIGRYTRELIRALASLDGETDYALFVAGQADLPTPPGPNFRYHTSFINSDWYARLWHRLRLPLPIETWTGPVDLLYAPDFTLPPVRRGTRTILTVHDLSFVRTPETATPGLRAYLEAVVPRSVGRADFVLADSEATRQDVIELYGTAPDKVAVLYSGVDARFKPVTDQDVLRSVRAKYDIGERPYILSVGTVQPRKNYPRLVEAFHRLDDDDLTLVIAGGQGWLSEELFERIEALNLGGRVRITGFVEDADLPALYSGGEMLAFPSLYEGFGLPILEAMACGVPVVTSNVSSLPEVAGEDALLVDPLNVDEIAGAMQRLLEDHTLRNRLLAGGEERIKAFMWEKAARELGGHFKRLLA